MADLHLMSGDSKVKKHIVFIHGLGGDYLSTWQSHSHDNTNTTNETDTKVFWPEWLCEDIEDADIWSVGYNAPKFSILDPGMGLEDRAQNIYELLLTEEKLFRGELILVGHSLGGLIIKQILRLASDESNRSEAVEFVNRVSAVAFLATPHTGSDVAQMGNSIFIKLIFKLLFFRQPSAATTALGRNDPKLRELNTWYRTWCQNKNIRHLILMETELTKIFFMIVKPDSADPGLKEKVIPVDKNHINISKPSSKDDEVYKHILQVVSTDTLSNQELWLRTKFGLNTTGWKGYENWSSCPKGIEEEYIVDQSNRFYDSSLNKNEGIDALGGISRLRQLLLQPMASVRLVGLSGVGKTRFIQALFDERIGEGALPQENVFYTDMSSSPSPSPRTLLEKLIQSGMPSIIIVDNCPPDLHSTLTKLCKQNGSTISILTVEYDIREDQPEATDVFSLEPSSQKLIEKMLASRFGYLSQQDVSTIAEFSGGNARIANALASTIQKGESIPRLTDEGLFKRLFDQRHEKSETLKRVAEVLSLVYSFQFECEDGYSAEITLLSELSSISPDKLYRNAQELLRRGLAQQRSRWMAILPHPIANRLAHSALENIPNSKISQIFNQDSNPRILKSLSRRLGYLNDSEDAHSLVRSWLADKGLLDLLCAKQEDKLAYILLSNVAPIIPKDALYYIKHQADKDTTNEFFDRSSQNYTTITKLLRSLAYNKELFTESVELLCHFTISEKESGNKNATSELLSTLFHLYLSGTHAGIEQRLDVIKKLTSSTSSHRQSIGLELLDATLKSYPFSSSHGFDFGANLRDFGYKPNSNKEVAEWYTKCIDCCTSIVNSNPELADRAKGILAKRFRGLWRFLGLHDLLEKVFYELSSTGGWEQGRLAIRSTLKYDSDEMPEKIKQRLVDMEKKLISVSYEQMMKVYVLSEGHHFRELDELVEDGKIKKRGYIKAAEIAEDLGSKIVSENFEYFKEVLPLVLVAKANNSRLSHFGMGCAKGASDPNEVWKYIIKYIESIDITQINTAFLEGYIKHLNKDYYDQAQILLNDLLENDKVNYIFPLVQLSCTLDENAVHRIKRPLINKTSPTWMYNYIAYGGRHEALSDSELISILDLLWEQSDGKDVAFEILKMRFHRCNSNESYTPSDELITKGREYILDFNYNDNQYNRHELDYSLSEVAKICFSTKSNFNDARNFFEKISSGIPSHRLIGTDLINFFVTMIEIQPFAALDVFTRGDGSLSNLRENIFMNRASDKPSPFSKISIDDAVSWCEEQPQQRFKALASLITPYEKIEEAYTWTPLAMELLEKSPEPILVLDEYRNSMYINSWFGSRASILEQRTPLIQALTKHPNEVIAQHEIKQLEEWNNMINRERAREEKDSRRTDESFE